MTYIRLQSNTNMMVGEHGIQTFEFVVVVLLLLLILNDLFVCFFIYFFISVHPLLFMDKWFVQICLNVKFILDIDDHIYSTL